MVGQFGIESRSLDSNSVFCETDVIDYDKVYEYIDKLRKESSDYLLNAIGCSGEREDSI